ncbi:MAG: YifB family Mg chelatase-like AAA ATPase [Candidatus Paceibacterota bacterium]|jgi:magnesium chelatase family protein
MSIAKAYSAQLIGLNSEIITVEVDISNGLNAFSVVGLGDRAVEEAKDRISAAIKNSGYVSPKQKNQKVVISLAPADIRKEGPSFDLAMAIAYLTAAKEIEFDPCRKLFLGELSLEGNVRRVSGLLPILCQASSHGYTQVFIPNENREEASLARNITIYPVSSLQEVISHLMHCEQIIPLETGENILKSSSSTSYLETDMSTIRGNETTKRGLEIAAAGAHNIIMCGPPGTGKTMLAQCFSSILPPLSYEQSVEVTSIHSVAQVLKQGLVTIPPFRAPHHTASYPSIIGGGSFPKPGEITLAHRGVLFMDEFPEFDRSVIEALRQPLEDRFITISRARGVITFPAQCILIASMNPCPCGKGKENGCTCSEHIISSYRRKISGPIIDRLDIWLNINKIDYAKLAAKTATSETSAVIRERVISARNIQLKRYCKFNISSVNKQSGRNEQKYFNAEMSAQDIEKMVIMCDTARSLLTLSAEKFGLSGRAFHRVIKVAQTIADLSKKDMILKEHILEALQYRQKLN